MGLFDKRPPCAICGGKVKGLLPWKIEGNYICDDCHGVIDAQNGNDFTMEQFLKYRDFREQNQALREQFRVDEIVEFGFLSEKFVFDYEHSLFCMDKNLNKTIFHGSELKSFMISEDGAPLLEGSAKGFIHHESRVPQRIDELLPQVNQMLIQRQMQESMERLANRDKEVRPSYTSIDIPEPFKKFYIKLYLQHPYWSLYEFERTGPVIIGDVPDLNQYRIEYNESVQHLETLANALAKVAGFPQESAAPGQTVATAAVAAAAAAATAPTDAVAEIKKYKDRHHHRRGIHRQEKAAHGYLNRKKPGSDSRFLSYGGGTFPMAPKRKRRPVAFYKLSHRREG